MPIRITGEPKPYDLRKLLQVCSEVFPPHQPPGLLSQIVTRLDFQNRSFKDEAQLLEAIAKAVAEEALDIDLTNFKPTKQIFAQFKTVTVGRVGPLDVVVMTKGKNAGSPAAMAKEMRLLEQLRLADLRVVPVYGEPGRTESSAVFAERQIKGNFLDGKQGLNERQSVALIGALFGVEVSSKEAANHLPAKKLIETALATREPPPLTLLWSALDDFKAIQTFLLTQYINDLQGIIEFGSGRFYLIDPQAIGPIAEANHDDRKCIEFVKHCIGQLEAFKAPLEQAHRAWGERLRKLSAATPVPKLPPPPH